MFLDTSQEISAKEKKGSHSLDVPSEALIAQESDFLESFRRIFFRIVLGQVKVLAA